MRPRCTNSGKTFLAEATAGEFRLNYHYVSLPEVESRLILQAGVLTMGMFQVRVRVANPSERSRFFDEDFWVDTGALYSFIPEGRLNEIGIRPLRTRELILAAGRRDRRSLGEAVFTIAQLDESLTCPVIFAPADSLHLLGATPLENFGVQADPTTQS
jgi:predicted aspartyl protease